MLALQIYEAPLSKWKSLKNRRLQNWGMLEFFFVFSLPFSQLPPPPCKLHTEAVVEEKVHRVSPIDSIPPLLPLVFGIDRWCRPRKRTSTPRL
jgi:hypothetical protein